MESALFFLIFLATAYQVTSQEGSSLQCYDCDPGKNPDGCSDPVRSGVQQTNCEKLYPNREVNSTFICLSANITFFGDLKNKTGIYRGCQLQTSSVVSFCDWFKQETDNQNALMVSCVPCSDSRCNSVTFDESGLPNSSDSLNSGLVALLASVWFSTLFYSTSLNSILN